MERKIVPLHSWTVAILSAAHRSQLPRKRKHIVGNIASGDRDVLRWYHHSKAHNDTGRNRSMCSGDDIQE